MTAILNFTQPNLDGTASSAVAPDGSSSELRLQAPEAGNREEANTSNGKEFGELLNTRIVKKETGKERNFDASGLPEAEFTEENAEILATELKPGNLLQATENISINKGKEIGVTLIADPLLTKVNTEAAVEDGVAEGETATKLASLSTDGKSLQSAGKSGITRLSGEEIALLRSSSRGPAEGTGPDVNIVKPVSPGNHTPLASNQQASPDPVTQARITAPVRSDNIPTSVSLNADRSLDSQAPKGLPLTSEAEELVPETVRQIQLAPSNLTSNSRRLDSMVQADDGMAEIAAVNGKQLPDSGKPLPSVLLQTPAQHAPGLSGRTELMTRSVGNGRQRSIGKETGEVSGLEKVAQINNRLPLAELFGKVVSQVQPTVSAESGMHTQTSTTDSQATGLLAQHLAGGEKTSNARTSAPLAGLEGSNTFSLQLQPGSQEMSAQLGSRIRWMSNLNISSAEVKLYPAELGTLEIMITAEDDQARVNFITSTSAAKEMIESSLPRLRELLGQSGLLLEQGDVSHRDLSQSKQDSAIPVIDRPAAESLETEALEQVLPTYQRSASDSQIDHFA